MAQTAKFGFDEAYANFKAGNYQQCADISSRLLTQQPNSTDVLQLLGSSLFLLKDLEGALKTYETLLGLIPENKEVLNTYGCILRDLKRYPEAISVLQKALHLDNSYLNAAVNLAHCYHQAEEYENAAIFYKQLTQLFPDKPQHLLNYADTLYRLEDYTGAQDIYQKIIQLIPDNEKAIARLAWCLNSLGKVTEAINLAQSAKALGQSEFLQLELSKILLINGMQDEADSILRPLIETGSVPTLVKVGSIYYHNNLYENAIEIFLKVVDQDPTNFDGLNNLGVCYDQINDEEKSLYYFNKLLKIEPNNPRILSSIGAVYQKLEDRQTSIDYYDKALAIDPSFVSAIYNKGVALHEMGFYEESSEYFFKTLELKPDHEDASYNLGINFLAAGNYKEGFRHYFKRPRFPLEGDKLTPITPGMNLDNKKILLTRSQGIGDELFFLRFVHLLKSDSNTIYYRPDPKIASICERITEIDQVVDLYPEEIYDYCFEVDDLPLLLNIQKESELPPPLSLNPLPSAVTNVKRILGEYLNSPLTGITWRAGSKEKCPNPDLNYQVLQKEIPLEILADAVEGIEGKIVILQRNPLENEITYLKNRFGDRIIDLNHLNENLEDMLALLSLLDKHFGVSNTNIHLRAGLGLSADILVPYPPEWRWQQTVSHSPWFPNFSIFRQNSDGSWALGHLTP